MFDFYLHMLILLTVIFVGIRFGGVAFGLFGGLGVSILVFVFGLTPGKPPITVMLIILAVVAASSTLEVTGGLRLLVGFTEKLLRKHPSQIVFLGPICTYLLTVLVGTGHSVYPLLPVIYDVCIKKGIRPERAMAMSTVSSQMGITASPIAAATAVVLAKAADNNLDIGVIDVLKITIPATFIGVLLACTWSLFRGKDLDKDEEFIERCKDPLFKKALIDEEVAKNDTGSVDKKAKVGLSVFLLGIASVVVVAMFSDKIAIFGRETLLPEGIKMATAIQFMMLTVGGIILLLTRIDPKKIVTSNVFTAGMTAVIIIFGIAWLSDTIISHHKPFLVETLGGIVEKYPWAFAFALFSTSIFLKSQAATLTAILPLGFSLGIDPKVLIGVIPSCYAYFFFPFYPSDLAAISFDNSGTTRIGKYVLNHSFIIPGFIGVITATTVGYFLSVLIG